MFPSEKMAALAGEPTEAERAELTFKRGQYEATMELTSGIVDSLTDHMRRAAGQA